MISENKTLAEYKTTDLRISLVWRQRCFDHPSEVQKWKEQQWGTFGLEEVLNRFIVDLKKRGVLQDGEDNPNRFDLAMKIMATYLAYPMDPTSAVIPFNYCMLPYMAPASLVKPLLSLFSYVC